MPNGLVKAVLDYAKDPLGDPKQPYCERCGREIKDMSKSVKVTFNCDTFEVFLGHNVETGYYDQRTKLGARLRGDWQHVPGKRLCPADWIAETIGQERKRQCLTSWSERPRSAHRRPVRRHAAGAGRAGRGGGTLRLGEYFLCRASQPAYAGGVHAGGAAVPGLGRGAGGGAAGDHAGHGRAVSRRAWADRRPSGTSIWRRCGASSTGWCKRHVVRHQPGGVGSRRQGNR